MGHSVEWQKRIDERRWLAALVRGFSRASVTEDGPCDPALRAAVLAHLARNSREQARHATPRAH